MGFRNDNIGTLDGLLGTRSIVKKGNFALLTPDGLVKNIIPGWDGAEATILSSPKIGATFVDYLVTIPDGGKQEAGFGGDGVETFLYLISGSLKAAAGGEGFELAPGGYLYCPPNAKMTWSTAGAAEFLLYKRRYKPAEGVALPKMVCGSVDKLEAIEYEGMKDVLIWNLLPTDVSYDMNFHILSFKPGACHGYIETHVQEHGALMLTGQGVYRLDDVWVPVEKGDYIFMGAYSPQAAYGTGRNGEDFSYVYSKDCNRDEDI